MLFQQKPFSIILVYVKSGAIKELVLCTLHLDLYDTEVIKITEPRKE